MFVGTFRGCPHPQSLLPLEDETCESVFFQSRCLNISDLHSSWTQVSHTTISREVGTVTNKSCTIDRPYHLPVTMAYGQEVAPLFGLSTHAGTSVDVLLLHTVQSALHRCRLKRLSEVEYQNKIKCSICSDQLNI